MEYKIGSLAQEIKPRFGSLNTFIVEKLDSETFVFHSLDEEVSHSSIAQEKDIPNFRVIGGGYVRLYESGELALVGSSGSYGRVVSDVLSGFRQPLLEAYRKINPKVKEVRIE